MKRKTTQDKMRVLFVLNSLGAGGAEYSQKLWWEFLLEQEVDFRVMILQERSEGIRNILSPELEDRCRQIGGTLFGQWNSLRSVLSDFKPDLVHSTLWTSHLMVRVMGSLKRSFIHLESLVNTTYTSERLDDPNVNGIKLQLLKSIDRLTAGAGVDHWHALTQTVADHYIEDLGLPADEITVIPRGRKQNEWIGDENNRREIRQAFGLSPGDCLILNVGRQEYQKGQDVLIRALSRLKSNAPSRKWKCIILGRDGHQTNHLLALRKTFGLEDEVLFAGHRYDIEHILAASDLFVFPSRYEGQGGALIEAMAARLPVICPNLPVFREVLGTDYTDVLYKPEDEEELADQMSRFLEDDGLREEMAADASDRFEQHFRLETIHPRMWSLYESLIDENR